MSYQLWTVITLLLGAGLALLGGWLESIRSRKWKIEDLKRNRELNAKDYWLGKIEEIADNTSKEFFNTWQLANNLLFSNNKTELAKAQRDFESYTNYYDYTDDVKSVLARVQSIHVYGDKLLSDLYQELVNIIQEMSDICIGMYQKTHVGGLIQDDKIFAPYKDRIGVVLKKHKMCSKKIYRQLMQIRAST